MHANYLSGNENKMSRMKEYGFWLSQAVTDKDMKIVKDNGCSDYVPYAVPHSATSGTVKR